MLRPHNKRMLIDIDVDDDDDDVDHPRHDVDMLAPIPASGLCQKATAAAPGPKPNTKASTPGGLAPAAGGAVPATELARAPIKKYKVPRELVEEARRDVRLRLTQYETTRLVCERALQLEHGSAPQVALDPEDTSSALIAIKELYSGRLPLGIRRSPHEPPIHASEAIIPTDFLPLEYKQIAEKLRKK